jgi:hypothetical protein
MYRQAAGAAQATAAQRVAFSAQRNGLNCDAGARQSDGNNRAPARLEGAHSAQ